KAVVWETVQAFCLAASINCITSRRGWFGSPTPSRREARTGRPGLPPVRGGRLLQAIPGTSESRVASCADSFVTGLENENPYTEVSPAIPLRAVGAYLAGLRLNQPL